MPLSGYTKFAEFIQVFSKFVTILKILINFTFFYFFILFAVSLFKIMDKKSWAKYTSSAYVNKKLYL